MKHPVIIKRVYEAPEAQDGFRVFVDRLWPRGVSKETFSYDLWCKDLAPSSDLRKWFGHKVEHWDEFRDSYTSELRKVEQQDKIGEVIKAADGRRITLVYGAKDSEHNQALVLADEMNRYARAHKT